MARRFSTTELQKARKVEGLVTEAEAAIRILVEVAAHGEFPASLRAEAMRQSGRLRESIAILRDE